MVPSSAAALREGAHDDPNGHCGLVSAGCGAAQMRSSQRCTFIGEPFTPSQNTTGASNSACFCSHGNEPAQRAAEKGQPNVPFSSPSDGENGCIPGQLSETANLCCPTVGCTCQLKQTRGNFGKEGEGSMEVVNLVVLWSIS